MSGNTSVTVNQLKISMFDELMMMREKNEEYGDGDIDIVLSAFANVLNSVSTNQASMISTAR